MVQNDLTCVKQKSLIITDTHIQSQTNGFFTPQLHHHLHPIPPEHQPTTTTTTTKFQSFSINKNTQYLVCAESQQKSTTLQLHFSLILWSTASRTGGGGGGGYGDGEGQFGNLVKERGWQVRRMIEEDDEMRSVANIQAEAFYEPVVLFNDVFFQFFQAEVLSGLLYRLRNSPPDRYACLVAETTTGNSEEKLVGVADATVFRDASVLEHLSGADEYLYVSGIAVLHNYRRKKVASVLLKSCEMLARFWGYKYLVLRAYEDDLGARTLYTNAGYKIMSSDPIWTSSWIGKRRRVLMIKQCNLT